MNIVEIDNTSGDLRILALAIQALIETHPDRPVLKEKFQQLIDRPEAHSLYSPDGVKPYTAQLLQDILRTASVGSDINSASPNDQSV